MGLRLGGLRLLLRLGILSPGEFAHQRVSAVVREVHTTNVGVVESGRAAALLRIATSSTVEVSGAASLRATSASAGEGRAGELGRLRAEEVLRRLVGELIVSKSHADSAVSQLEPVHLLKGFFRVRRLRIPVMRR